MSEGLPTLIDPKYLALQGCHLQGKIALTQMIRLSESLSEVEQKDRVYIDWLFTIDAQNRPMINGYTQAQLPLLCQRCLQVVLWPIKTKVALQFVTNSNADLPKDYETFTLTNAPISLISLVEDELILALPIVAKHKKCLTNEHELPNKSTAPDKPFQNNPFHVLEKLKE